METDPEVLIMRFTIAFVLLALFIILLLIYTVSTGFKKIFRLIKRIINFNNK